MQLVPSKVVAEKLTSYLHHELELAELVDWVETLRWMATSRSIITRYYAISRADWVLQTLRLLE